MATTVSARTRRAVEEHLSGWDGWELRRIRALFEDEGLAAVTLGAPPPGERRALAASYLAPGVDNTSPEHTARLLRVCEQLLDGHRRDADTATDDTAIRFHRGRHDELAGLLARDGFALDDDGALHQRTDRALLDLPVDAVTDPSALQLELDRLLRDWDRDAGQVIATATRLVEATCKRILTDRDALSDLGSAPKVPALVNATVAALQLHPGQIDGEPWGHTVAAAARQVLGGLSSIAGGLAQLRNTSGGHGQATARILPPRWGHLAAGAAVTLCRMLLETHAERPAIPTAAAAGETAR